MPVIRRFKPTIGGSAAATPATEHAPNQATPVGPGSTLTGGASHHEHHSHYHGQHHHHHHHHEAATTHKELETPPAPVPLAASPQVQQPLESQTPVHNSENARKRPPSISISVSHSQMPSPPLMRSPAQKSISSPMISPLSEPVAEVQSQVESSPVSAGEALKIKRAHVHISQENLNVSEGGEKIAATAENSSTTASRHELPPPPRPTFLYQSPACSSETFSSRPASPTPSVASSTTSSISLFGTGIRKKRRSLLNKPIELPGKKEEINVELLKMRDYVIYNPDGSPMRWRRQEMEQMEKAAAAEKAEAQAAVENLPLKNRLRSNLSSPPPPSQPPASSGTPRVRLGESGEAIINEDSLVIDTVGPRPDPNTVSRVGAVHEEMESTTTYTTYAKYRLKGKVRGRRWSKEETARFFVALRCCGLDFSMIAKFFPDRQERELRNKFKAEDKRDPDVITRFLSGGGNDDDLGSYDPLALLATSMFDTKKKESSSRPSSSASASRKTPPNGNSKRGEGVPRGRGGKVRLTIGEDSVSSDSSDQETIDEPVAEIKVPSQPPVELLASPAASAKSAALEAHASPEFTIL